MKKTTSLKIEPIIWDDLKVYCAKKKISMSLFIEKVIEKELGDNCE